MPEWTPELRAKTAESVRRSWERDPERRKRQSIRQRRYRHSPETIEKIKLGVAHREPPSLETLKRRSKSLRGRILTKEDKEKKRQSQRSHAKLSLQGICGCFVHRTENDEELGARMKKTHEFRGATKIEKLLVGTILNEFPEVRTEKQFGCYHVDAYLPPPYHLAFEADGEYWHRHPKQDAARDAYLLRKFNLPVVRLTGQEILNVGITHE